MSCQLETWMIPVLEFKKKKRKKKKMKEERGREEVIDSNPLGGRRRLSALIHLHLHFVPHSRRDVKYLS